MFQSWYQDSLSNKGFWIFALFAENWIDFLRQPMSSSNSWNVCSGLSLSFFSVYGYFFFIFFNGTRKLRAKWRNRFLSSDMPLRPYGFTILILHGYTKIVYSSLWYPHSTWIPYKAEYYICSKWMNSSILQFRNQIRLRHSSFNLLFSYVFSFYAFLSKRFTTSWNRIQ